MGRGAWGETFGARQIAAHNKKVRDHNLTVPSLMHALVFDLEFEEYADDTVYYATKTGEQLDAKMVRG